MLLVSYRFLTMTVNLKIMIILEKIIWWLWWRVGDFINYYFDIYTKFF